MGALFLNLKPGEYLKKQYKTKKLVEKTSFSLQAEHLLKEVLSACRQTLAFVVRTALRCSMRSGSTAKFSGVLPKRRRHHIL
ncbi:hypothetical protein CJZ70_18500 [Bacillus subtilis]|nr:hypothetical protein CJZ70_18500 [Bacillus subtilis]